MQMATSFIRSLEDIFMDEIQVRCHANRDWFKLLTQAPVVSLLYISNKLIIHQLLLARISDLFPGL
jgi:hypothetical protein